MKYIIKTAIVILSVILISGCKKFENFLEKPPGVGYEDDKLFSNEVELDKLLSQIYRFGMVSGYNYRNNWGATPAAGLHFSVLADFTDESQQDIEFVSAARTWNNGAVTNTDIINSEDNRYYMRWIDFRLINLLLKRIDEVPGTGPDGKLDPTYKNQIIGQVKFIRALNYFEMFQRYGGVPIVEQVFEVGEEVKVPRSTVEQTVNFIVKDCDEAFNLLPAEWVDKNDKGRPFKATALALKARVLLYAASPLFNTGTPYISMNNPADNKLICYGNTDINRWKLAADAAKALIDHAESGGKIKLVDDPAKRVPALVNGFWVGNYRDNWNSPDNSETLLLVRFISGAVNAQEGPWTNGYPKFFGGFIGGPSVPFNFQLKYETTTGSTPNWNMAGGNDLNKIYNTLDYRFKQTVAYVGSKWNADVLTVNSFIGGFGGPNGQIFKLENAPGSAFAHKMIPDALRWTVGVTPQWPLFRLNEAYLNYAEALNEFTPNAPEAYAAINKIRTRSGMPNITSANTPGQDAFRQRIRNERAVELAYENHRFWDVRRWLVAENEGIMKGAFYGIEVKKIAGAPVGSDTEFSYKPFVFMTRAFNKAMYLHPFQLSEVLKGNLTQNPGW